MRVRRLSLVDFRSYPSAELSFEDGVTTLLGSNGQGKTNVLEALGYLSTFSSHRVATDLPLVRYGAEQAVVRGVVARHGRDTLLELELNPGRANRARVNRSPVARPREILGTVATVLFAPEDLALVKGDPAGRRDFLDGLLVARHPRWAAVRGDVDRILKQRNALLRSAAPVLGRAGRRRRRSEEWREREDRESALHTLDVWNAQLAAAAGQLLAARLRLLADLSPHLAECYRILSGEQAPATARYRSSLAEQDAAAAADGHLTDAADLERAMLTALEGARDAEIERGVTLVGPHRDDVVLSLGPLPARGYASHGEAWSLALGLKLAAYRLLREDLGEDPVLLLDDVFAELDTGRRDRLAELVADGEQVVVTAAVEADVPEALRTRGGRYTVTLGSVEPVLDGAR